MSFVDPSARGRTAALFVGTSAATDLLAALLGLAYYFELGSIADPADSRWAAIVGLSGVIQLAVLIGAAVAYFRWLRRVYANTSILTVDGIDHTPGWAVGHYFIPIVSLYRPYQVMKEIWEKSRSTGESLEGSARIGWWWGLFLVSQFAGNLSFRLSLGGGGITAERLGTGVGIISDASSLFAAVFLIPVIIAVGVRQQTKSREAQVVERIAASPKEADHPASVRPSQLLLAGTALAGGTTSWISAQAHFITRAANAGEIVDTAHFESLFLWTHYGLIAITALLVLFSGLFGIWTSSAAERIARVDLRMTPARARTIGILSIPILSLVFAGPVIDMIRSSIRPRGWRSYETVSFSWLAIGIGWITAAATWIATLTLPEPEILGYGTGFAAGGSAMILLGSIGLLLILSRTETNVAKIESEHGKRVDLERVKSSAATTISSPRIISQPPADNGTPIFVDDEWVPAVPDLEEAAPFAEPTSDSAPRSVTPSIAPTEGMSTGHSYGASRVTASMLRSSSPTVESARSSLRPSHGVPVTSSTATGRRCARCGRAIEIGRTFCAGCGLPVRSEGIATIDRPGLVSFLAVLHGLVAGLMTLASIGFLFSEQSSEDSFVVVILIVIGVMHAFASIGMWRLRPWGRYLEIFGAGLALFGFPLGTILGGAILYYMFRPGIVLLFSGRKATEFSEAERNSIGELRKSRAATIAVAVVAGVFILGILAAIAIPNLLFAMQRAKQKRSIADIEQIAVAVDRYAASHSGTFPQARSVAELRKILNETFPEKDGWGRDFLVLSHSGGFAIGSAGKDGRWSNPSLREYGIQVIDNPDDDIVFLDGRFVSAPKDVLEEQLGD